MISVSVPSHLTSLPFQSIDSSGEGERMIEVKYGEMTPLVQEALGTNAEDTDAIVVHLVGKLWWCRMCQVIFFFGVQVAAPT